MKHRTIPVILCLSGLLSTPLLGEEPYFEFVEAMRRNSYFDYAMLYLEELRSREDVPSEVKDRLSFEEYRIFQERAKLERTAAAKEKSLEKALAPS